MNYADAQRFLALWPDVKTGYVVCDDFLCSMTLDQINRIFLPYVNDIIPKMGVDENLTIYVPGRVLWPGLMLTSWKIEDGVLRIVVEEDPEYSWDTNEE